MPIAALKLIGPVNQNETAVLNENSGISSSNLVRFLYDPNGLSLVQKLGGWQAFVAYAMPSVVRALWAWEDLNLNAWLAVGCQTVTGTTSAFLGAITAGNLSGITPTALTDNITPAASSTAGSATIEITDATTTGITQYNSVYIATQISIGGVILYGLYQCDPDGFIAGDAYTVFSIDQLGNLLPATATSTSPVLPVFTTTSGEITVTVTLPGFTYTVGETFPVLVPTTVGGITFYGNYIVQSITGNAGAGTPVFTNSSASIGMVNTFAAGQQIFFQTTGTLPTGFSPNTMYYVIATGLTGTTFEVSATPGGSAITAGSAGSGTQSAFYLSSTFTILSNTIASSSASGTLNGGDARYIYSFGSGVLPAGTGYGSGYYGQGGYGTGTAVVPATGTPIDAVDWTLDNFGELLIACPDRAAPANGTPFQPIYAWLPGSAQATILTNAPPVNDGIFVAMPERQIVAWGSTETGIQDPLLISWCDVNNPDQWIPLVTNQAGQFRIPTGSRIVGAVQGPQQCIVWTDVDVYAMQYIGPPNVWGFTQIGKGCGLIARKAAAFVNGIGYWMGPSQFFTLSAYGVQILPCTVWDVVYQNLHQGNDSNNIPYVNRIRVSVNSRFGEIQWFYPSMGGNGEVDSYVKYNVLLNLWDYGTLGRSAWVDQSVLGPPVGADPVSLMLYQHETSNDAAGTPMDSFFQTGYFALNEGSDKTFMDWVWPDMKWGQLDQAQAATVQITFYVMDYPNSTSTVFGPYSVTQATTFFYTRLRGRLISIKISSSDLGTFWRIGLIRYRYAQDGRI
jgi:hypothetical protein